MTQNSKQLSNRKLRKLGVGAASMMIGLTMLGAVSANNMAHADTNASTIPVAAKPVTTATNSNSTSATAINNSSTNNGASTQEATNQSIKAAPAVAGVKSGSTSTRAQLNAVTPAIISNPSYDASATTPSVVDEQVAHGVYISTADSSRTPFSNVDNQDLHESAVVNPTKTSELTAHGVITNTSNQTKHVEAIYALPNNVWHESGSVVYQYITLDDSRFDPSKGLTAQGGTNVAITYGPNSGVDDKTSPAKYGWSKVAFVEIQADLAAGQSINVDMPLKIDTSKITPDMIYGEDGNYWANRFHIGEWGFWVNNQQMRASDLQMRIGDPTYDLSAHAGEYFMLAYRNSNGHYTPLSIETYKNFSNSSDATAMQIDNNVHFVNYHPAGINNAQLHDQAVRTNNEGGHIMWSGAVYFIDLADMQKVLTKYGYSFNLNSNNSAVMPYYSYDNFGKKVTVKGTWNTIDGGQKAGLTISPDMYIEVHQILAGQDVTVQDGKVIKIGDRTTGDGIGKAWNYLDNVAVAKGLNGANEVAVEKNTVSCPDAANVNTAKDGDYTITLQLKLADGETVTTTSVVHVIPLVETTTESHDVTRTINIHQLDGSVATTVQTVHFTRTKTTTDGKVAYSAWAADGSDSFARFMIPAIAGYHASERGVTVTSIYPVEHVAADAANIVFDVYYVANHTQPTTPVNPSTTPTTPVNPSTTPTTPVNPSTTPTTPVNPSTTPTTPVNPSTTPTTPVNPSTTPTTPVNPSTTPTTPVNPSTTPTTPVNPSTTPTTPVNPSTTPTTPVNPSTTPTTPVNPSTTPTTPVNPSTTPTTPVNPSTTPTTPVNPSTTPNKPSDQHNTQPNNPSQPTQPTTPVNPSQPTQPTTPVNPSTPNKPSDQNNTQPNTPSGNNNSGNMDNNNAPAPANTNKPSAQGATANNNNGTAIVNEHTASTVTPAANAAPVQQQGGQQKLPQTGNSKSGIFGLIGLALSGLAMMFGYGKRREN